MAHVRVLHCCSAGVQDSSYALLRTTSSSDSCKKRNESAAAAQRSVAAGGMRGAQLPGTQNNVHPQVQTVVAVANRRRCTVACSQHVQQQQQQQTWRGKYAAGCRAQERCCFWCCTSYKRPQPAASARSSGEHAALVGWRAPRRWRGSAAAMYVAAGASAAEPPLLRPPQVHGAAGVLRLRCHG